MLTLTNKLFFNGLNFYLTGIENNNRVYKSLDELIHYVILTNIVDYDGVLIGVIGEQLSDVLEDDFIRYFDSVTGIEE